MMHAVLAALPFGIDGMKILLYVLNFVILFVGLTFLLYRPIKKFIKKRQDDIQESIAKGEQMQADAQAKQDEYDKKLLDAATEAESIKKSAEEEGVKKAQAIVSAAEEQAQEIKHTAQAEAKELKREAILEAKDEIADAVITLASEVVDRELSKEDNERIISKRLDEWKDEQ